MGGIRDQASGAAAVADEELPEHVERALEASHAVEKISHPGIRVFAEIPDLGMHIVAEMPGLGIRMDAEIRDGTASAP